MADTEKGDSSTGEAKAKKSMLDDDFSKDFLSSWKSMSTTGSDDMDFDFEPVSKGKKKTFDFGMDMDFSLDDAFGKMSSFKIDMPDFDFSTSPKKSTKPKEKSKEQDKHDDFLFSFDFDGGSTAEKTMLMKNKDPGHMNSKNPVTQATNDGERTEPSDSENNREGSTHIESVDKSCSSFSNSKENEKNSDDCPRSFNKEREKIEPDSVLEEMDKIPATHIDAVDNSGHHEKNSDENTNSCTKDSVLEKSETISVAAQITPRDQNNRNEMSADTVSHNGNEAKDGLPSLKNEKTINNAKSSRDMDFSLDDTFGKISSFKIDIPDVEFSSSPIKTIKPKEKPEEDSGEGNCQDKHDKFSYSLDFNGEATTSKTMLMTNKVLGARNSKFSGAQTKNDSGKTDFSASEDNREGLAHIGAVDKSAYGDGKHNGKNSNNAHPSSCSKELSKSDSVVEGNNEIAAACIDDVDRRQIEHIRYEEKKSDENTSSCTKGLIKTDPVLEESEKIASVPIESVDMRYGDSRHTETNSDDSKISCTKDLIKPSPVLEKTEKISVAFTPSRDHDDTVHGKQRNEMSPDSLPHTGKEAMHGHGLSSLENKKMVNNVKSSGFRIPSVSPAEQRNKFGNQGQGKFNNKISGIASIQNLNIGQGDKVSAQRIDKKVLALPSLNFSRSSIKDKNLSAPTMQRNAKSPGNVEKNMNLQATIKMVSPVSAEKQTPSTPSLKRKLSEAADMIPAKLHTPKRVSTSESRMSKISAREVEHVAQTKGNLVERNSKNVSEEYKSPKFDFSHEANREALQFSMAAENDENVEKAEACSKELDNICNMLKKKHEEAKELLVRALVNNNNLLMLNHPIYEEKIRAVQRLASRLMSKELEVEA